MSHTYSNLLSHVVCSTKDRRPQIDAEMKPRLLGYINGIVNENGGKVLSLNSMPDHMHMLWELPPTASLSDSMRVVKANSSRWVHETWGSLKPFGWLWRVQRQSLECIRSRKVYRRSGITSPQTNIPGRVC